MSESFFASAVAEAMVDKKATKDSGKWSLSAETTHSFVCDKTRHGGSHGNLRNICELEITSEIAIGVHFFCLLFFVQVKKS
ncbi:MAG: hypothetical protein A2474_07900 [Elusimicrobia bacterium RIFOXYC2_FULL_34_12]|nr:MAG: hypothetical protein A2474_07900 [Elusimicrobia bacterium RIFOXYC2_FULL_34_12]